MPFKTANPVPLLLCLALLLPPISSKNNREVLLEEIKLLREDPSDFAHKLSSKWSSYFEKGSIGSKIRTDFMRHDFKVIIQALVNTKHSICEFDCYLQFDADLDAFAGLLAREVAGSKRLLESGQMNDLLFGFADKVQEKEGEKRDGRRQHKRIERLFGANFVFSSRIEHLTDVLVFLMAESDSTSKSNLNALMDSRYNFAGVGFEKRGEFVYAVLLMAEKKMVDS